MQCRNDDSLGPAVQGCRDDFDFTIVFEHIVMSIIPASILLVLGIVRLLNLRRRRTIVSGQVLALAKLAFVVSLGSLQATLLGFTRRSRQSDTDYATSATVAAATNFTATLLILPLSWFEHSRSARPSVLLGAYLSITLLFDIAQTRTAWLLSPSGDQLAYARLLTAAAATKALLLVSEAQHKTKWLLWDQKQHSPEETSGLYSLGAFFWLNRLFLRGHRGMLSIENLYPLDNALAAETMRNKFMKELRSRSWRGQKWGLVKIIFRTLGLQLVPPIVPRIALLASSLCQPLLINALLDFLQSEDKDENHGYGLIAATGLTYIAIAISSALYWYYDERFLIMMRGCLVVAVYEQTTSLKLSDSEEMGALTVMSADVELIMRGFRDIHEYWANMIQIGVSCWLLQRQLGAAFAAPLVVVLVSACSAFAVGSLLGTRQRAWMAAIQKRVSVTASAITQMKLVKMSGMTEPVQSYIQQLRVSEIAMGGRWRTLLGIVATLSFVPITISPVMTFAVAPKSLDTTTIFVSISYLTLLASPLMVVFQKLPQLLGALTCLKRIQTFLERDSRLDSRTFPSGEKAPNVVARADNLELASLAPVGTCAISVIGGTFAWDEETIVLKDVNLSIPQSQMVMVVGPVASGKSTLCKALLGELPVSRGTVSFRSHGRIGYCSQQPFLSNTSIRNNIVGFEEYNHERYSQVLEATMLDQDIASFSEGDQTSVGSGAIALSGGQRQRLAIARALYITRTEVFIFDDVLSGLDSNTEKHVFERVFGQSGILRRRNATILLCTHKKSHLEQADQVVRLDDGTITTHETSNIAGLVSEASLDSSQTSTDPTPASKATPPVGFTEEEAAARKLGDFKVYGHYLRTVGPVPVAICLLASLCHGFLLNFPKVWLTFWSDDAARPEPAHSQGYYIGIYGVFEVLFLGAFVIAGMTVLLVFIKVSGAALHQTALETVINAPLRLFTQTDTGTITNYFAQDMTLIDGEMPLALLNMILAMFGVLGMAALLASSAPWLALAYPGMILVLWFVQRFYLKTSRQLRLLDLEAKAPLYSHFIETLKGLATIRALGWEADSQKHSRMLLDRSQKPTYLLAVVQRWLSFVLNMVVAVIATILVTLVTQLRGASSSLSGASLVTLMSLSSSLSDIVKFYAILETSIGAVARLRSFSDRTGSEKKPQQVFQPDAQWPSQGSIEVRSVSASYSDSDKDLALRDMSVSIKVGEKVALCGRTGSGKSSTILLLLGLLEPIEHGAEGFTLAIDGVPLSSVDRKTLREHLITVPQDAVFLPSSSTVGQNLDPSGVATPSQLQSVAEDLDLQEVIEAQGGMDGPLVESSLSHGQRQIFSLARAVLKHRITGGRILLLDEFTSSVDAETERTMLEVIRREFVGCTVVMIAHRLDMIMDLCDRVIVMDQGAIVEAGDPRVLRQMEETWFAALIGASTHA